MDFDPKSLTGFEGYIAAKLEGIEDELMDIKKRFIALPCSETFVRIGKIESKIANIEGKAAAVGGIFGLIVAIVAAWIKDLWK